ncbi:MAG: 50S ribosomal protein L25 [Phycisphaerales bacterium]|nr:50S ribosomal protein L25 [Planctomycetota bacterium]MCH8507496.1 50S ribosomal protein L25 [Phycisphaerales bacterium]
MHEDAPVLNAKLRDRVGSRYAKRIRETGGLPAVVYGHKEDPQPVTLEAREALRFISRGEKVFSMELDGKKQFVLLKDLGYDYLGTNIIHADFARVDLNERVDTRAHLKFVGEAKGLKKAGAVLMHPVNELQLNCLVTNLPDQIEVDVSGMDVGDVIHAGEIELPVKTMKLLTDPDTVVVQIIMKAEEPESTGEAASVDGSAEPEVLTAKKEASGDDEKKKD